MLALLCGIAMPATAELYYWQAADGSLMATDQPPPAGTTFRTARDLPAMNIASSPAKPVNNTDTITPEPDNSEPALKTVKLSPNAAPQEVATESTADTTPELAVGNADSREEKNTDSELSAATLQPDDEAGCQKLYGVNCDKVFNWRQYGEKYCAEFKHDRCSDAGWFENRFKPVTLAERHQRVLRNAAKKSREAEEIRNYLHRKYTGICAKDPDKAPQLCKNALYDAKILASFNELGSADQAQIKQLQQVLKTSQDRNLRDRAIEQLLSYLPWATAASGL